MSEDEKVALALAIVDTGPDAIIYADRNGRIGFWNRAAERLLGFTRDEALGRSLDIIIPPRLRERHWQGFDQMMATGVSTHAADAVLSVPAETKSGATLSVEFTVTPVRDPEGCITGIAAVLRDATERFRTMRELKSRLAAATRAR